MSESEPSPIVDLQGISVSYGHHVALDDVSLTIYPGATGLVGRNGAGKSTLLRLLLGFVRAEQGTGQVLGIPIDARGEQLRYAVGYMPESDSLVPGLRGVEQVALAGELCGLAPRESLRRAHDLLAQVGLGEARYRDVDQYSTGMKQRLKLAVALVHDPALLLLDEPTVGLDPPGRKLMLDLMCDLVERHEKSLLISTHLLDDIQSTCQAFVMVEQGEVLAEGPISATSSNGEMNYQLEWEGDGTGFLEALTSAGAVVEVKRVQSTRLFQRTTAKLRVQSDFQTNRFFQLARQSDICLRTVQPKSEEISDLYNKLVRPDGPPNQSGV